MLVPGARPQRQERPSETSTGPSEMGAGLSEATCSATKRHSASGPLLGTSRKHDGNAEMWYIHVHVIHV